MRKTVDVYLAGGIKSGWQNQLKMALRKLHDQGLIRWSDPQEYRTRNPDEIKLLNMIRLKNTDIIFANEQDKDSDIASMHSELESAKLIGKPAVVLVIGEKIGPDLEHQQFRTDKWHLAVNMLEEMILAIAGGGK